MHIIKQYREEKYLVCECGFSINMIGDWISRTLGHWRA